MPTNLLIDCHVHAHWPRRYPYLHPTGSRIGVDDHDLSAESVFSALRANGVTHTLLIQPGAYAFDNRAMLDAIAASNGTAKALAAIPFDAPDEIFADLKQRGVVGVRLSLVTLDSGLFADDRVAEFLGRCRKCDFWVEVFAKAEMWPLIVPHLLRSEVKVIVEHFGYPLMSEGLKQPGVQAILQLGRTTGAVCKLSCAYRISWMKEPYEDMRPYVLDFIGAFGIDRTIWGSDWPFLNPDNGPAKRPMKVSVAYRRELEVLSNWIPNLNERNKVLSENPARMFGFDERVSIGGVKPIV